MGVLAPHDRAFSPALIQLQLVLHTPFVALCILHSILLCVAVFRQPFAENIRAPPNCPSRSVESNTSTSWSRAQASFLVSVTVRFRGMGTPLMGNHLEICLSSPQKNGN